MATDAIRLSTVESKTTIKTRKLDDGRFERVTTTTTTASTLEDLDLVDPPHKSQQYASEGRSLFESIFGRKG